MKAQAKNCDRQLIDAFLDSDHVGLEDEQLVEHLNTCAACREYLETQAADSESWSSAARLLQAREFDHASAHEYSCATHVSGRIDQPTAIQHVLDLLAPSEEPSRLGRLGTYEVSGVIGVGGMGVVLKAVDPALDRVVAIKVLAPHLAHHGTARRRFSREAKAAAAVLHPNVIPIHSVSNDDKLPYLVMAYIRGGSLQKRLDRDGPLPTVETLRIGSQIAAGLAAAHEQGLVHRDIKPENILLEESVERVTITDFGLARAVDDASLTQIGAIAGTPQYMSPEQANGQTLDQRSDLFSLGSVMYALCTGRAPFRASSSHGVMRKIIDEHPTDIRELNSETPDWLCAIIDRLMAKDKDDRFKAAAEVHQLLESCLSHIQQPTVRSLPKIPRLLPQKKRNPISKPLVGTFVMITAIASLLFAFGILPDMHIEQIGGQSSRHTDSAQDDSGPQADATTDEPSSTTSSVEPSLRDRLKAGADGNRLPDGLPPLIGSALASDVGEARSKLTIALTLPSDTWRAIKDEMPDLRWPEIEQTVMNGSIDEGTMTLPIGDSAQPTYCRIVDASGNELGGDQIIELLKKEATVLVSASGQMPGSCFLQLPTTAKAIVLLGPGEKLAGNDSQPPAVTPIKETEIDLKDWTEERSQHYFFQQIQRSQTFTIKTEEGASKYLQGVWRLDKRAHVGGGHYVRADQGDDVAVICTDEWLVFRLVNAKDTRDATVAHYEQIDLDEKGHLHLTGEHPISYNHFQPLDEDHMAVLNYDFIAVVERVACVTPESANNRSGNDTAAQDEKEAMDAARAHLRALLKTDEQFLSNSYAATVRMLRKDEEMDRAKAIDAAVKQFAGGGEIPAAAIGQLLDRMKFESVEVTEGEFVTPPSAAISTKDGSLRFTIEKGDSVVRITQGRSAWFLQLRKSNNEWTVVAEYTD